MNAQPENRQAVAFQNVSMTQARARLPRYEVDWWQVVTDLGRAGLSHRSIAERCGVDKSVITRLRNGVNHSPLYSTGVHILAVWMDVLDRNAAQVPMVRPMVRTSPGTLVDPRPIQLPGEPTHGYTSHHPSPRPAGAD